MLHLCAQTFPPLPIRPQGQHLKQSKAFPFPLVATFLPTKSTGKQLETLTESLYKSLVVGEPERVGGWKDT